MTKTFSRLHALFLCACAASAGAAPQRLSAPAREQLRARIEDGRLGPPRWPDFRDYRADLREFYQSQDYSLAWIRDSRPSPQARRLAELFACADDKGLMAEDYGDRAWLDRLVDLTRRPTALPEAELAALDSEFTVTVMRYVSDRRVGRMSLAPFRVDLGSGRGSARLAQFLRDQVEEALDVDAVLDGLERPPRNPPLTARCEPSAPLFRSVP
jgi:hypothetical protein